MKRILLLAILFLIQVTGFSQVLTIDIPEHRFRIDPYDHIIVIQPQNIEQYTGLSDYEEIDLNLTNFAFQFVEIPDQFEYTGSYMVNNGIDDYHLYFTQLPLLKIQSSSVISNGNKIPSEFYYADDNQILVAQIGIAFQDTYLSVAPKKSYSLEFWTDTASEVPANVHFGTMQSDDDWILNSMYNDPLRLRTPITHKLWLAMHQPSYLQEASSARAGADAMVVELFVNGHYSGVYMLTQQIERKLLALQEFDGNIRGELYKGKQAAPATLFTGAPAADNESRYWAGHRMIYPEAMDTTNWENIRSFTQFVLNSDSIDFENIWSKFDYQNYLDYFIFLNLTRTADNTGKNIYMAKYDSASTYFYVPWQLNGSFGMRWDGTVLDITDDILTNGFMDRVIENDVNDYTTDVQARWAELRTGPLTMDSLIADFTDAYDLLKANNIYEREALVYPNYPFDQASFNYIDEWIQNRIAFLDIYFNYTPTSVAEVARSHFSIYPNPSNGTFKIQSPEDLTHKRLQIIDLQGKVVKSEIYNGQSIAVSDLGRGFYIVKINNLSAKVIIR